MAGFLCIDATRYSAQMLAHGVRCKRRYLEVGNLLRLNPTMEVMIAVAVTESVAEDAHRNLEAIAATVAPACVGFVTHDGVSDGGEYVLGCGDALPEELRYSRAVQLFAGRIFDRGPLTIRSKKSGHCDVEFGFGRFCVGLTRNSTQILLKLVELSRKVTGAQWFSAEELIHVLGTTSQTTAKQNLTTAISRLNKQLADVGAVALIETGKGNGYRLAFPSARIFLL